jgi:signal transduction histidine kinase
MEGLPAGERQVTIRTSQAQGFVDAAVVDRGSGLSPPDLARVFEPYYTTKPDGLGMGLSISSTIIENHHGKLDAFLNADRGVTFRFRLPLAASGSDNRSTAEADSRALVV